MSFINPDNKRHKIDRIQQYIDDGAEEIMFSGIPSKPKLFELIYHDHSRKLHALAWR